MKKIPLGILIFVFTMSTFANIVCVTESKNSDLDNTIIHNWLIYDKVELTKSQHGSYDLIHTFTKLDEITQLETTKQEILFTGLSCNFQDKGERANCSNDIGYAAHFNEISSQINISAFWWGRAEGYTFDSSNCKFDN